MTTNTPALTDEAFAKIVAVACLRSANSCASLEPFRHGDASAVRYGAITWEIGAAANLTPPQTRYRLNKLFVAGKVLRVTCRGGGTRWWPKGLAEASEAPNAPSPPSRAVPVAPAQPAKAHWSKALGLPDDASTSEARAAYIERLAAVDDTAIDSQAQRDRLRAAIDACCREHEVQVTE